jgi:hypothetical protein
MINKRVPRKRDPFLFHDNSRACSQGWREIKNGQAEPGRFIDPLHGKGEIYAANLSGSTNEAEKASPDLFGRGFLFYRPDEK